MNRVIVLVAGVLFGAGLALSGMVDPARVRGFLDPLGDWDPTLAFVMAGALVPMALAWRLRAGMAAPLFAPIFAVPETRQLDWRLACGSALFGIGWGIAGLCPGPALADLALAPAPAAVFVGAMLGAMGLYRLVSR